MKRYVIFALAAILCLSIAGGASVGASQGQGAAKGHDKAQSAQSNNPHEDCNGDAGGNSDTGHGANKNYDDPVGGTYDHNCVRDDDGNWAESGNGEGGGESNGKPCAGCVGEADDKNPPGQFRDGDDSNNGYECDGNNGIAKTNPAHTGCARPTTVQPAASVRTVCDPVGPGDGSIEVFGISPSGSSVSVTISNASGTTINGTSAGTFAVPAGTWRVVVLVGGASAFDQNVTVASCGDGSSPSAALATTCPTDASARPTINVTVSGEKRGDDVLVVVDKGTGAEQSGGEGLYEVNTGTHSVLVRVNGDTILDDSGVVTSNCAPPPRRTTVLGERIVRGQALAATGGNWELPFLTAMALIVFGALALAIDKKALTSR